MKYVGVFAVFSIAISAAAQEYDYGTFSIRTAESLYLGAKYKGYPVGNLFDGDAKTAWVFKGLRNHPELKAGVEHDKGILNEITIDFDEAVIDSIKLVNGYAKDAATWKRNNRIKRVRVWATYDDGTKIGEVLLGDVPLADEMGWKTINFKPVKAFSVRIRAIEFYKGTDNDFAISEVQLLGKGKPLPLDGTRLTMVRDGGCCCSTETWIEDPKGRKLDSFGSGEGSPISSISEDGRYIAGAIAHGQKRVDVRVYDTKTGRVVARKTLKVNEPVDVYLHWTGHKLYDEPPGGHTKPKLVLNLGR